MKLFHYTLGEGKPLLILHGLFGISDNWMGIGKVLAENFRVIIPDLRNHGRSPHADAFGYPPMCDDLLELMEGLDLQRVILLGHSMGGKLAMHFALQYQEMVSKLVVVDISPRHTRARQIHFRMMQAMKSVNFDTVSSRQEVENILSNQIESKALRLFILKNLIRIDPNRFAWRPYIKAIEHNIDNIMKGIPEETPFHQPTLFIRGQLSDYITDEDIPAIRAIFPDHRIETIADAGHWVHADQPEAFLYVLMGFLI